MDPHIKLRSQIRAARELLNMKQSDVATALDVSLSKISRVESGETKSGDILLEIKHCLEHRGVLFTKSGVELVENHFEILEGQDCYLQLLDDIHVHLKDAQDQEFLIMFAAERRSPPEVNMRYQLMLKTGIHFRKLIADHDNYIMGKPSCYKTIPAQYFSNILTLVYGNRVAQSNGDLTRITIYEDALLAGRERQIFTYLWDIGGKPLPSIAKESYEQN
jgi:transcriptional regulator with XRE-family HTH domain